MKFNLNRLKAERVARGLTQDDVGQKLGITKSGYSKLENGENKLDLETFVSILNIFNIDVHALPIFFTN